MALGNPESGFTLISGGLDGILNIIQERENEEFEI